MALRRFFAALGIALKNGAVSFLDYYKREVDPLTRDPLTMAWNRPHFERRRTQLPQYALLLIDIDNFKQINDGYGHSAGDVVLRAVAAVLRTGSGDRVFRVGGEEFAVLLASCSMRDAAKVADRLCHAIRAIDVLDGGGVTVSVGVASALGLDDHDVVYRQADQALYYAKWTGKNRVAVFDGIPLEATALEGPSAAPLRGVNSPSAHSPPPPAPTAPDGSRPRGSPPTTGA